MNKLYIKRRFKSFNQKTEPIFINQESNDIIDFKELLTIKQNILIIKEPDLRQLFWIMQIEKTYKNIYYIDWKKNQQNIKIQKNIETIFIDGLDEVVIKQKKIQKFILDCKKINPNIRFIFGSRSSSQIIINTLKDIGVETKKYLMKYPNDTANFEELMNFSNISIILGEPASGKTYQFKVYKENNENVELLPLVALKESDIISTNTEVVLIDSIDEALIQNNHKSLVKDLKEYILRCKKINPNVKFIISSRLLEWKEYFEETLREVDSNMRIYEILPLSTEEINILLKKNNILEKEFWNFIKENYLESLLKNILILLHIIDKFKEYQKQSSLNYITIYHDLVNKYITQKGEDRIEDTIEIPVDKLFLIASSLATYMTFESKGCINIVNLDELAGKLYKINGNNILSKELKVLLRTGLFKKVNNKVSFFHKSIQEYLTAYFLDKRALPLEEVRKLLSNDLRFYEEFEEVIVFLTNIRNDLFDNFVEFDPFIFRRHPNLTQGQQEKLLISILNKFKNNRSQIWGRWEFLQDTTLVKFNKLSNIVSILKRHIVLKEHGYYLMELLNNNYSEEFKEYVLELFEKNISNKETVTKIIRGNFVNNYDFNISLYSFMKKYNLFKKDLYTIMPFEMQLFSSLYGIEYKSVYSDVRILQRTNIDFSEIIELLDFIPESYLKYIVPYLEREDTIKWYDYMLQNYSKDKYSYKFMNWVIYAVLKDCDSNELFINIINKLQEKKIYIHSVEEELKLDFSKIEPIFWQIYFENNILQNFRIKEILKFYKISLDNIKNAVKKYPIEKYVEKYTYLRLLGQNIDSFLMQNSALKQYLENIRKQQEEENRKWEEQFRNENPELFKKPELQKKEAEQFGLYLGSLKVQCFKNFATNNEIPENIYNIFYFISKNLNNNWKEVDEKAKELLKEKYPIFIQRLKEKFKDDVTYREIKKELTSNSLSNTHTFMFKYLFEIMNEQEINELIKTKKNYIKFFWHSYRFSSSLNNNFLILSKRYFECFKILSYKTLKLSLIQSNNKEIGNFYILIDIYKKLNKFNYENLKFIIEFIKKTKSFKKLNEYQRKNLLEILSLDKELFEYLISLIETNKLHFKDYLSFLITLDAKKALNYFFNIYSNIPKKRSLWRRLQNKIYKKVEVENRYDRFEINPQKIKLYKTLIISLKSSNSKLENIDNKYLEIILQNYYEFFKQYNTPQGVYSPDIYDDMNNFINKLWEKIGNSSQYISLLLGLKNSKNKQLRENAKYALSRAYEQQRKERSFSNDYYKGILDMPKEKDINVDIKGNKNIVVVGNNNQIKNKAKSKNDNWLWISLGISAIVGGIIWWESSLWWGMGIFIVIFLIMWIFHYKFRFFRIAWIILTPILITNGFLNFIGTIKIPKNSYISGIFKFGQGRDVLVTIALIILIGYLFYLDQKERK